TRCLNINIKCLMKYSLAITIPLFKSICKSMTPVIRGFLETNRDVVVRSSPFTEYWKGLDGAWTSRFLKFAKQLQPELDAATRLLSLYIIMLGANGKSAASSCTFFRSVICERNDDQGVIEKDRSGLNDSGDKSPLEVNKPVAKKHRTESLDDKPEKARTILDNAATLVLNSASFQCFPVNAHSNFGELRANPKLAYLMISPQRSFAVGSVTPLNDLGCL
ncbi:7991_t:CDS:2, partial [Paraglomus occultum]